MRRGLHIGKIVVKMPEQQENLPLVPKMPSIAFQPDCSYFLVGGLGGLGRAVAVWMVEHGARHLSFLSRSAGSPAHNGIRSELEAMGCSVRIFAGNVAKMSDVERVFSDSEKPIGGIMNLSMVVRVR